MITHERLPKIPKIINEIVDCDGLVITTPTYWFNLPAILKSAIEHLTVTEEHGYYLEGKVAGAIAYGPDGGATDVLENLALVLTNMGCVLPPYSLIWFGQKDDQWTLRDIDLLAQNMVVQIKAQCAQNISWDYAKPHQGRR